MSRLIALNKPYATLCQFTDAEKRATLANLVDVPRVYPAGRLDRDSEGLVLLTDDGALQQRIADPRFKLWKTYWVQVEGNISPSAVEQLTRGVELKDGKTRPARATVMACPENLWQRDPPIRQRKNIPTSWLKLSIREGRNRQVRRMTAATGFPTLRLIRYAIGSQTIDHLGLGQWCDIESSLFD